MSWLRRVGLRLFLALGLSFIFWVFVWISEGGRDTYRNVPVDVRNLADDLVLVNENGFAISQSTLPDVVTVSVEADAETLATFDQSDLQAFVDLSTINTAGNHDVDVMAEVQGNTANASVVQVDPETLDLRLEQWITRTVPLTVEVQGSPPFGYESGIPDILARRSSSQEAGQVLQSVQVVGPQNRVEQVEFAFAAVNIDQMRTTSQSSLQPEPRDANGNTVEGVELAPDTVFVRVPIYPVVGLRRVPVVGTIEGTPAPGYVITSIQSEPPVINLSGSSTELDQVNQVTTEPVNISGATRSITRHVDLAIPRNTQPQGGETRAVVTVGIAPQTRGVTVTLYFTVEISGAAESLLVSYDPLVLPITLSGLPQELERMSRESLTATVDVGGLEQGDYTLEPQLALPDGVQVVGDNPQVQVSLLRPDTPTMPPPSPTAAPSPTPALPTPTESLQESPTATPLAEERATDAPGAFPTPLPTSEPVPPTETPPALPTTPPTDTPLPAATPTATVQPTAPPPSALPTPSPTSIPLNTIDAPDDVLSSLMLPDVVGRAR